MAKHNPADKAAARALAGLSLSLACLAAASCGLFGYQGVTILYPREGTRFEEGQKIEFYSSIYDDSLAWSVRGGAAFAEGPHATKVFAPGDYVVDLIGAGKVLDSVGFSVAAVVYAEGDLRTVPVREGSWSFVLDEGDYLPFAVSQHTSSSIVLGSAAAPAAPPPAGAARPLRDMRLDLPANLRLSPAGEGARDAVRIAPRAPAILDEQRDFYMVDLDYSYYADPLKIRAACLAAGDGVEIWSDTASGQGLVQADADALHEALASLIVPRLDSLWGPGSDLDQNQALIVLASRKVNAFDVGVIGFFNPADFFPRSADMSDYLRYNPASNFGEILYLGVVDADDPNYSLASLRAACAHEYSHLLRFYRQAYRHRTVYLDGSWAFAMEELFLDEGLAHLSENLCGFGESGGNYVFADAFLSAPWQADMMGFNDTAAMRGGMARFLSWLTSRSGGIAFNAQGTASGGALEELRALVETTARGHANLKGVFGRGPEELLRDWGADLAKVISGYAPATTLTRDTVTGEIFELDPFGGSVNLGGEAVTLDGPVPIRLDEEALFNYYTVAWFEAFSMTQKASRAVRSQYAGPVMYFFMPGSD